MLLLAIDSATPVAGVALLNDDKIIKEEFSNYKKTHSETLMPVVDRVLRECERSLADLDAFILTMGPGSFTGLRIGGATVKGLSMATGKPIITVSTLDVLAHNVAGTDALVCPLLDARKNEVYTSFYDVSGKVPVRLDNIIACAPEDFIKMAAAHLKDYNQKIILVGDGYYAHQGFFKQKLGTKLVDLPPHLMLPRAAALASLGREKYLHKEFTNVFALRPAYIRLSEAETRLGGEV